MKILFTTPILEHPPAGGPQLRIENSIKVLARVSSLHVVSRLPERLIGGSQATRFFQDIGCKFSFAPSVHALSEAFLRRNLQKIIRSMFFTGSDVSFLIRHFDEIEADIMWFGYGNISWPIVRTIKRTRPDIKVVCDTDSVWSRFILRELDVEQDPKKRLKIASEGEAKKIEERDWVNTCDATLAVSDVDAEYYRSIARDKGRVRVFSNVIDLASYAEASPPHAEPIKNPSIYLAGTFGHADSPMDRAARWIVDEILPLVRRAIPDVHFYIVGKNSDLTMADVRGPGITVTGKVDSVLRYLPFVDVVLVPLKFESGTRFKILEAGAVGQAVVSTTLGAEGIEVTDGQDIILADDSETFAAAIIRVLRDRSLAKCLGNGLRELVTRNYSLDTLENQARDILNYLAGSPARALSSDSN